MKANIILSFMIMVLIIVVITIFKNNSKELIPREPPYYVSIKSTKVNVRTGPGLDYPIIFIYQKRNTPVKVLDTYGNWYKIEDVDGSTGWLYRNLTKKNNYIINKTNKTIIYKKASINSKQVGSLGQNTVVQFKDCAKYAEFCYIKLDKVKGFIKKENVWGYK